MADSVTVADLPAGFDLYGAYDDGTYKNLATAQARFPGKTVVSITVFATDDFGDVLDVETGDATPADAPAWCQQRRASGADPTVYCSDGIWAQVKAAFTAANEPMPHWWIAAYPGIGQQLYPGTVAHQWIDRGPYDESVVADYWPGVDPAPVPPPNYQEDENMTSIVIGGQLHVFGVIGTTAWHWWQEIGPPASAWHSESLPA